ncbi:MAG: hypothetical protein JWQ19_2750 [Subtercola sp.]|nr:hypothetical protein [Subtercola sp.]
MNTSESELPGLLVVGDATAVHLDARQIRHSADTGQRVRLRRGVYVGAEQWHAASAAARYRLRVEAAASTRRRPPVLGYWSAAAVWGYPRVGPWPDEVHVVVPRGTGAHSRSGIRFHREQLNDDEVTEVGGLTVTSPARTLVDLARTASFRDAVVAIDSALDVRRNAASGQVSKEQVMSAIFAQSRGAARATRAVQFANGRAVNPGESLSRILVLESGFPSPELQTEHANPDGGKYFTDFEWPRHRIVGEFDGRGKYLKDEFLQGRAPGDVVYAEKRREDHLRAEGNTVVRWGWHELHHPGLLVALLGSAGLPFRSRELTLPPRETGASS